MWIIRLPSGQPWLCLHVSRRLKLQMHCVNNEVSEGARRYSRVKQMHACKGECERKEVRGKTSEGTGECESHRDEQGGVVQRVGPSSGLAPSPVQAHLGSIRGARSSQLHSATQENLNPPTSACLLAVSSASHRKTWADRRCIWTNWPGSSRSGTCCSVRPWQSVSGPSSLW